MVKNVEGGILSGSIPTHYSPESPIALFIIQLMIIIVTSRLLNILLSPLKQPRIISEIIGGIIIGPSVFGQIPNYMQTIFPKESISLLRVSADIGLIYFLFIIGVEMNPRVIMKNVKGAIAISAGGIITCFALGVAVGYGLYNNLTDKTTDFSSFLIFIGVAMSITAFPVLARILSELELIRSRVGVTTITACIIDDVVSWILFALVISLVNSGVNLTALYVFLLCIGWVVVAIFIIRPILIKLIVKTGSNDSGPTLTMMAITLSTVLISALVTKAIGIHQVLGGFIIGVIIPHERGFAFTITEKIEDLVYILFLPTYFALSGLKTNLELLNNGTIWLWVFIIIVCAMMGKIIGCSLMAKLNKYTWRDSLTIGIFMSCKGLIEFIILNVGHDSKVINDEVFVAMIVMTIVTTITTSPLATLIYSTEYRKKTETKNDQKQDSSDEPKYNKILVVLNNIEWLPAMMTLIQLLQPSTISKAKTTKQTINKNNAGSSKMVENNSKEPLKVHALRMVELTDRISAVMKFNESEEATLRDPIMKVFRMFGHLNHVNVMAQFKVVPFQNFSNQVAESVRDTGSEMVIIPWNGAGAINEEPNDDLDDPEEVVTKPIEQKSTIPKVSYFVQEVFNEINTSVGFLIDRGLSTESTNIIPSDGIDVHVYLPFFGGVDDREALSFVSSLLDNSHVTATIIRIKKSNEPTENDTTLGKTESMLNILDGEAQRPPLAHEMSTTSNHVLNSSTERLSSIKADEFLLSKYFKVGTGKLTNNPRVNYHEITSSTPLQTAVERGKSISKQKDLVVVGRGRYKANLSHRDEFSTLMRNLGLSYGNDTRKCLGDIAEAFLINQIASSLFVIQGRKSTFD